MKSRRLLIQELLKYKLKLLSLIVCYIVTVVISTMYPGLSGAFVDSLISRDFTHATKCIVFFGIITIIFAIFFFYRDKIKIDYRERVAANINNQLIAHLHNIPLLKLLKMDLVGLGYQIYGDAEQCASFVTDYLTNIFYSVVVVLIGTINIWILCPVLVVAIIMYILIYVSLYIFLQKIITTKTMELKEVQKTFFSVQTERLERAKTIKSNQAENYFERRSLLFIEKLLVAVRNFIHATGQFVVSIDVLNKALTICLWIIAFIMVINNRLSVAEFVTISALFEMITIEMQSITEFIVQMLQTSPCFSRINDILDYEEEELGSDCVPFVETINTSKLYFGYDEGNKLIENNNISFTKGKIYLLKGVNGRGKSTLLNLLSGIYTGYEGDIYFNNFNLKTINKKRIIGIVEQEPLIINGTIKENILLGIDEEVGDKAIKELMLHFGLSNIVDKLEETADGLSGGEKQKLAIIRVLLKNPDVMFFDEATSALDLKSTDIFKKEIESIKANHIIIMAQHGDEMDDIADEIIHV